VLSGAITNTVIVLIGFAGTGKYTIGREVADRMGAKLIHNHLINNSLFTAINADGVTPPPPGIWPKVRKIRQVVYETIRFDPGRVWQLHPQALRPRRGFRAKARINGCAFDSAIVPRQKRWFLLVDADIARSAGVSVADRVQVTVEPL